MAIFHSLKDKYCSRDQEAEGEVSRPVLLPCSKASETRLCVSALPPELERSWLPIQPGLGLNSGTQTADPPWPHLPLPSSAPD